VNAANDIFLAVGVGNYGLGISAPDVVVDGLPFTGADARVYTVLLKLNGSTGTAVFGMSSTGGNAAVPINVVANPWTGNVSLTGIYEGSAKWGVYGTLPQGGGGFLFNASAYNGFVPTSIKALDTAYFTNPQTLGEYVTYTITQGTFVGTINLGGGPLTSAGSSDIFVTTYSNGSHIASARFGGAGSENARMAVAGSKRWIAGDTDGDIDFGGNLLHPSDKRDAFVAVLDDKNGHLFSEMFPGTGNQEIRAITTDTSNRATVLGSFQGDIKFGDTTLISASSADTFVASFGTDYGIRWVRAFGAQSGSLGAYHLAADPKGAVWIGGFFTGTVDFGKGPVSAGNNDIFLLKLAP
jgi:hypothetical protein